MDKQELFKLMGIDQPEKPDYSGFPTGDVTRARVCGLCDRLFRDIITYVNKRHALFAREINTLLDEQVPRDSSDSDWKSVLELVKQEFGLD